MRLAIIAITKGGQLLSRKLASQLQADIIDTNGKISDSVAAIWSQYDGFIFIMATGIVVRVIAPLLEDKTTDPSVVVLDEAGNYAISLLAGHLGGANQLAREIALLSGGQAVITTASDTLGLTALDLWAKHNDLQLTQGSFTEVSTKLVNNGFLKVFAESCRAEFPPDFKIVNKAESAELIISNRLQTSLIKSAVLRPKNLVFGIGCNRGTTAAQITEAFKDACQTNNLSEESVCSLASIDLKHDEQGLLDFAKQQNIPLQFHSASQINEVPGIEHSEAVFKATGAHAVAEPCALLSANTNKLVMRKMKWQDVTMAIAEKTTTLSAKFQ